MDVEAVKAAQAMFIMAAVFFGAIVFLRTVTATERLHLAVSATCFLMASLCFALAFRLPS